MKNFKNKEAFKFGWETFKKNWKFLVVLMVAVWVIFAILGNIVGNVRSSSPFMGFILQLGVYVANAVVGLGMLKIMLNFVDGKKVSFKQLYESYPLSLTYIVASILYGFIVAAGLILLVVPGIYWGIKYQFYGYLIVDKNASIMNSLKNSGKITAGNKTNLFVFGILGFVAMLLGLMLLGVGILVAGPVVSLAHAYIYRKLER